MALIAMVSAKSAPGITTSVALLASVWPSQVVVVDADPVGGSLATGWLGGLAYPDRSILSFAIETANSGVSGPAKLDRHLQRVPGVPDCLLMAGLTDSTQLRFITSAAWHRLANAPRERDWGAARCLAGQLRSVTDADRLGLAVCATTPLGTMATEQYLGLYAIVALPNNRRVAMAFSDRSRRSVGFGRSRLVRTAARTASLLHVVVNKDQSTVPPQVGAARVFDGPQYESKWSG